MKKFDKIIFLACGLLLMLAALPVLAQQNIELNKKPLQEFDETVKPKVDNKEIDFSKLFLVEIEGYLTNEGRLDTKKTKIIRREGDTQMDEVAVSSVLAISDSGFFAYLGNLGIEKVNIIIGQDDKQFYTNLISEVNTIGRAKTITSSINTIVQIAKIQEKNEDTKLLLNNLRVSNDDKKVIFNCSLPATTAQEMIKRNLLKYANRKNESNS